MLPREMRCIFQKALKGKFNPGVAFIFRSLCTYVFILSDSFIILSTIKESKGAKKGGGRLNLIKYKAIHVV